MTLVRAFPGMPTVNVWPGDTIRFEVKYCVSRPFIGWLGNYTPLDGCYGNFRCPNPLEYTVQFERTKEPCPGLLVEVNMCRYCTGIYRRDPGPADKDGWKVKAVWDYQEPSL